METIHPQKSNVMVECNHEREDIGSSKRFKGSEEMIGACNAMVSCCGLSCFVKTRMPCLGNSGL